MLPAVGHEEKESVSFSSSVESPILPQRRFALFVYGYPLFLLSSATHGAVGYRIAYVYEPILSFFLADPDRLFCVPYSGLSIWKDLPAGKPSVRFAQRWLPRV